MIHSFMKMNELIAHNKFKFFICQVIGMVAIAQHSLVSLASVYVVL